MVHAIIGPRVEQRWRCCCCSQRPIHNTRRVAVEQKDLRQLRLGRHHQREPIGLGSRQRALVRKHNLVGVLVKAGQAEKALSQHLAAVGTGKALPVDVERGRLILLHHAVGEPRAVERCGMRIPVFGAALGKVEFDERVGAPRRQRGAHRAIDDIVGRAHKLLQRAAHRCVIPNASQGQNLSHLPTPQRSRFRPFGSSYPNTNRCKKAAVSVTV